MITSLPVPIYSQRDPRWGNLKLGTSNVTLSGFGCLISSISMMDGGFDPHNPWNPAQVNAEFVRKGGYANGNLVIWSAIQRILPNSQHLGVDVCVSVPAPTTKIKEHLDAGGLAIIQVGFGGDASKMHWLLAVGYDGDDIIFNDPWYGDQSRFASQRYGSGSAARDILTVHYFIDAMPDVPPAPIAPPPAKDNGGVVATLPAPAPDAGQSSGEVAVTVVPPDPEWVASYVEDASSEEVKRSGVTAIDPADPNFTVDIPQGYVMEVAGYFTFNGVEYARSTKAVAENNYRGIPSDSFRTGQASGVVPVKIVDAPVDGIAVAAPELPPSPWREFCEALAKLVVSIITKRSS